MAGGTKTTDTQSPLPAHSGSDRRNGQQPPLIAHIVFRFGVGGLENGIVNLINRMPEAAYQHAIICLTDYDAEFFQRIKRPDVGVHALHKAPGKDIGSYWRLWRLLRCLKPDVVHTRNLGTIDCLPIAAAAGVPVRIHGEHGWDVHDLHGTNRKYRWLRRAMTPFIHRYIVVSRQLGDWLRGTVKIPKNKIIHICNGVDTQRFTQRTVDELPDSFVIGFAGRFADVKDPLNLVEAFIILLQTRPDLQGRVRLLMLGDGKLHAEAISRLQRSGYGEYADLPGSSNDVASQLQRMSVFVLPSRNEGISNTILEAMATGLPVVATRVGGNPELVCENDNGLLVSPEDSTALAHALIRYLDAPDSVRTHGQAGRHHVETLFSLQTMVEAYMQVYDAALRRTMSKRS